MSNGNASPASNPSESREGTLPFPIPGVSKATFTWYKTLGPIHSSPSSTVHPLVIVHGGPGLTYDYLKQLDALWYEYKIPLVFYDQIGNGRSTHLPEKNGDEEFWVDELFHSELENLVHGLGLAEGGYDILGHSWGGMMGATFAGKEPSPKGLRRLILSNSPADVESWGEAYKRYLETMEEDVKEKIKNGIEREQWESLEFEGAMEKFMTRFCVGSVWPEELLESFGWAKKDGTVAGTMWVAASLFSSCSILVFDANIKSGRLGPNEFEVTGSRKGWSAVEAAKKISVPTLVINGTNEGATDEAIKPFLDGIKTVKWVKFHESLHMPMYQEKERYLEAVSEWLKAE